MIVANVGQQLFGYAFNKSFLAYDAAFTGGVFVADAPALTAAVVAALMASPCRPS